MLIRCAARLLPPSTAVRLKTAGSRAAFVLVVGSATSVPFLVRSGTNLWRTCNCEAPASLEHHTTLVGPLISPVTVIKETSAVLASGSSQRFGIASRVYWTIRLFLRATRLWLTFAPVLLLYPLMMWTRPTRRVWWALAVVAMQYSGPTLLKFGQWSGTRRDLFSKEFCEHMSILQRNTGFRSWSESESVLDDAFGKGVWKQVFINFNRKPIGSGCIAQIFKAQVNPQTFSRITGIKLEDLPLDECVTVAIKIAHPSILHQIQMDMGILRFGASIIQRFSSAVRYMRPMECLDQFQVVLEQQVDLRHEGRALQRFGANFDQATTNVCFPMALCYTRNMLVETFEPGVHVNELVTGEVEDEAFRSPELKHRVALKGARALLKMIFVDNLVHGDLHPGNILIRLNDFGEMSTSVIKEHRINPLDDPFWKRVIKTLALRFTRKESPGELVFSLSPKHQPSTHDEKTETLDPTLVFIDAGITVVQTPKDLANLRAVFRAIVLNQGEKVGELLLSQSPHQECENPAGFIKEIARLVGIARNSKSSMRDLNISSLLSQLLSTVSHHQVSLEPAFCCVIMSVMLLEGLGRSLDPNLDLFKVAAPYLI